VKSITEYEYHIRITILAMPEANEWKIKKLFVL